MDRTLLRKLTWKSKLGFGKYADMTVKSIFIADRDYLGFVYYNCDMIDFCDEIKQELQLIEIAKPGKSPETKPKWEYKVGQSMIDEQRMHYFAARKVGKKRLAYAKLVNAERSERRNTRRGILQARNHGHLK